MDESAGLTMYDRSGYGSNITASGATRGSIPLISGMDNSTVFPTGAYCTYPVFGAWTSGREQQAFTVEFACHFSSSTASYTIFQPRIVGTWVLGNYISIVDSALVFSMSNGTTSTIGTDVRKLVYRMSNERVRHVACTYDGNSMSIFIDGKLVAKRDDGVATMNFDPTSYLTHATASGSTLYLNGMAIYRRALSESEIASHYQLMSDVTSPRDIAATKSGRHLGLDSATFKHSLDLQWPANIGFDKFSTDNVYADSAGRLTLRRLEPAKYVNLSTGLEETPTYGYGVIVEEDRAVMYDNSVLGISGVNWTVMASWNFIQSIHYDGQERTLFEMSNFDGTRILGMYFNSTTGLCCRMSYDDTSGQHVETMLWSIPSIQPGWRSIGIWSASGYVYAYVDGWNVAQDFGDTFSDTSDLSWPQAYPDDWQSGWYYVYPGEGPSQGIYAGFSLGAQTRFAASGPLSFGKKSFTGTIANYYGPFVNLKIRGSDYTNTATTTGPFYMKGVSSLAVSQEGTARWIASVTSLTSETVNLLSRNQSSACENGTMAGFSANGNCWLSAAPEGMDGAYSLQAVVQDSGQDAEIVLIPSMAQTAGAGATRGIVAGRTYSYSCYAYSLLQRKAAVGVRWYNSSGAEISTTPLSVSETMPGSHVQLFGTAVAPSGAVAGAVFTRILAETAVEYDTYLFDCFGLWEGTSRDWVTSAFNIDYSMIDFSPDSSNVKVYGSTFNILTTAYAAWIDGTGTMPDSSSWVRCYPSDAFPGISANEDLNPADLYSKMIGVKAILSTDDSVDDIPVLDVARVEIANVTNSMTSNHGDGLELRGTVTVGGKSNVIDRRKGAGLSTRKTGYAIVNSQRSGDYVSIPASSGNEEDTTTSVDIPATKSVEFWSMLTAAPTYDETYFWTNGNGLSIRAYVASSGRTLRLTNCSAIVNGVAVSSGSYTVPIGEWIHVVLTSSADMVATPATSGDGMHWLGSMNGSGMAGYSIGWLSYYPDVLTSAQALENFSLYTGRPTGRAQDSVALTMTDSAPSMIEAYGHVISS